jgi:hypothetical protein
MTTVATVRVMTTPPMTLVTLLPAMTMTMGRSRCVVCGKGTYDEDSLCEPCSAWLDERFRDNTFGAPIDSLEELQNHRKRPLILPEEQDDYT